MYDVLIVGAGPGGMSAAIYAARSNLKVGIIEFDAPGGKMVVTSIIENYPGFKAIDGPDLSFRMFDQISDLGVEYIAGQVTDITKENNVFQVTVSGEIKEARAVIVASGTVNRTLGVPGESTFRNHGISWCAVCDGPLYKGQDVAVIGGGNSAFKESMYLADLAKKVYLIHRSETFRSDPILQSRIEKYENIELVLNSEVVEFKGKDNLETIVVKNNKTSEITHIHAQACFEFLGHGPATKFLNRFEGVTNQRGFMLANDKMETAVSGLFAVGDVVDKEVRQIATAVNDGVIAALQASKYIRNH